jgi:hypothetical protein
MPKRKWATNWYKDMLNWRCSSTRNWIRDIRNLRRSDALLHLLLTSKIFREYSMSFMRQMSSKTLSFLICCSLTCPQRQSTLALVRAEKLLDWITNTDRNGDSSLTCSVQTPKIWKSKTSLNKGSSRYENINLNCCNPMQRRMQNRPSKARPAT